VEDGDIWIGFYAEPEFELELNAHFDRFLRPIERLSIGINYSTFWNTTKESLGFPEYEVHAMATLSTTYTHKSPTVRSMLYYQGYVVMQNRQIHGQA
jgi:hypothetical protein